MLLFFIGICYGIISGMGIGGGTILIPAMVFLVGTTQHVAQSINLAVFFPTAIIAILIHASNRHIKYKIALHLFAAGTIGAFIGSQLAVSLSSQTLRKFFGLFLLLMGIWEFIRRGKEDNTTEK